MDVSILICTYNRCDSLGRALESLRHLNVAPDLSWEVLVVDNNSTDGTKEIIRRSAETAGFPVVYIFEPTPGSSEARNAGIQHAKGDIVCFLDDDVIVHPDWLTEICNAYREVDAACIGGKVLLPPDLKVPRWWDSEYDGPVGKNDLGDNILINEHRYVDVIGANLSFRRWVFEQYGLLSPKFSRRGKNLVMGEESDLIRRLRSHGHYAAYYPRALVYHVPSPARMTVSYMSRWQYRRGEWEWYRTKDSAFPPGMAAWFGAPRWLYRVVARTTGSALLHAARFQTRQAIYDYLQLCFHAGTLVSFLKASKQRVADHPAGAEAS